MKRIGALRCHWAYIPTDGWLPHFTSGDRLRPGAAWLMEWRRVWVWWEPERPGFKQAFLKRQH